MKELYFVRLYSVQSKNKLEEQLFLLASEYERMLISKDDFKEISDRYHAIIDGYKGSARIPNLSISMYDYSGCIKFHEGLRLDIVRVKESR